MLRHPINARQILELLTAEHLTAIALQTGRAKDFSRIIAFLDSGLLDRDKLSDLLRRHALDAAWARFETRYLSYP